LRRASSTTKGRVLHAKQSSLARRLGRRGPTGGGRYHRRRLAVGSRGLADDDRRPLRHVPSDAPGGYKLADYQAKWSNPYGMLDMSVAPGDTRRFDNKSFYIDDAPSRTSN